MADKQAVAPPVSDAAIASQPNGVSSADDVSIGELVQRLSAQTSELVRTEVALAQAEIKEKGKHAGLAGGLFGGAGVIALFLVGAAIATAIIALDLVLALWLSALIVTALLALTAAALALVGRREVSRATPPVPERTRRSLQADVRTLRERAGR